MADDGFDEDIFDDLYDDEPATKPAPSAPPAPIAAQPEPEEAKVEHEPAAMDTGVKNEQNENEGYDYGTPSDAQGFKKEMSVEDSREPNYGPITVKEDG